MAFRAETVASRAKSVSTSRLAAMRLRTTALLAKMSCTFSVPAVMVPSMIFSPPLMLRSDTSSLAICLSVVTTCPPSSTDTE